MKVLIVGSNGGCSYGKMYREAGYEITVDIGKADLVQFTGGSDVSPHLYGEKVHATTMAHPPRDEFEKDVYEAALSFDIPMVGICRGGQFLNVMNGGKMYQHVDDHGIHGTHKARDVETGRIVQVTSTHHQMMRPADNAIMVCFASLSTSKQYMKDGKVEEDVGESLDTEAVYYEDTKCLCFQPHPEFNRLKIGDTREYFFELLKRYIPEARKSEGSISRSTSMMHAGHMDV